MAKNLLKTTVNKSAEKEGKPDRVIVFLGQKIQIAQYEPADVMFGYETDVQDEETIHEAYVRAKKTVEKEIRPAIRELKEIKKENRC